MTENERVKKVIDKLYEACAENGVMPLGTVTLVPKTMDTLPDRNRFLIDLNDKIENLTILNLGFDTYGRNIRDL